MLGINEILGKLLNGKELNEQEKFKILHSKRVDKRIIVYLINKLSTLHIEVLGKYEGSIFELMPVGKLEGWCWQTTESVIVFLNDSDYIERGYLYFDKNTPRYYHSWICFRFRGIEYVLDPCLSFLCKKSDYFKLFNPDVRAKVYALDVKNELIRQLTSPKKINNNDTHKSFESFFKNIMGDSYETYQERKRDEVIVHAPENINTPLYRNGCGYKGEIENNLIKKLTVHYYYSDC